MSNDKLYVLCPDEFIMGPLKQVVLEDTSQLQIGYKFEKHSDLLFWANTLGWEIIGETLVINKMSNQLHVVRGTEKEAAKHVAIIVSKKLT